MRTNQFDFRQRLAPEKKKNIRIHYEELLKARKKRIDKLLKAINQQSRQSGKEFKALVSKSEEKAARALVDKTRIAIAKIHLPKNSSGNPAKRNAIKRKFTTSWPKNFKAFQAIQKLLQKHRGYVEG